MRSLLAIESYDGNRPENTRRACPTTRTRILFGGTPAHALVPRRPRPGCQRLTRRLPGRRSVLSEASEAFVPPFKGPEGGPDVKGLTTRCGGPDPSNPQEVAKGPSPPPPCAPEPPRPHVRPSLASSPSPPQRFRRRRFPHCKLLEQAAPGGQFSGERPGRGVRLSI